MKSASEVVTAKLHHAGLRQGLPYGAVMATGGAAVVAGRCGLHDLVLPLLVLALAQALWLPVVGVWRCRSTLRARWRAWRVIGPAHEHSGIHTVPLGLAVIASALLSLQGGNVRWSLPLAAVCLALAWALTLVCVGRFVASLIRHGLSLPTLDGAWFLVPAALLGVGIASQTIAPFGNGYVATALSALALAGVLAGWIGYWLAACVVLVRVRRHGLGGVPQAPWWIAMGCAGLAAAGLGSVLHGWIGTSPVRVGFEVALAVTAVVAVGLCVPVLLGSAGFLARRCRFRMYAAWPPTFSTAVFALGCFAAADVLHAPVFHVLALGAGYATLLLWLVTTGWNVGCTCGCWGCR